MTALAAVPDTSKLSEEAAALVARADALVINDAASYAAAAEFGKGVKALQKKIAEFFAPMKKKSHEAWKTICDSETRELSPTKRAEQIVKAKLDAYRDAERAREDAERLVREKKARQLEEDRRIAEAIDLDEAGDRAAAEDVLRAPIEVPATRAPLSSVPKVAGVATVKRWTFEETAVKLEAVIKHIAGVPQDQPLAHPELRNLLCLDTKVTQQLITGQKDTFNVPGIHAFEKEVTSLGSK